MLFMVIERFKNRDAKAVYRRFRDQGRGAPEGLRYVNSWIEASFDRCFQVMECDDARLLQRASPSNRCCEPTDVAFSTTTSRAGICVLSGYKTYD